MSFWKKAHARLKTLKKLTSAMKIILTKSLWRVKNGKLTKPSSMTKTLIPCPPTSNDSAKAGGLTVQ
jgi:hypothetical protein